MILEDLKKNLATTEESMEQAKALFNQLVGRKTLLIQQIKAHDTKKVEEPKKDA